jgi:hypothetical protein
MAAIPKKPTILIYRLYAREPVSAGEWYHTLTCNGCGKLIYPLEDKSGGTKPLNFLGDADLSVACPRCCHDDTYKFSDLKTIESQESFNGFRPPRVGLSSSSRKPLLPQFRQVNPIMGVGLIEDRPKAAAIVGRIITAWADIEVVCARLLAKLMGTEVPAVAAVFGALRSSRAQADAMDAAAQAVLEDSDHLLFSAHMVRKAALEKERNDLAPGCFGVIVSLPEAVVWVSQADYITFTTTHQQGTDPETLEKYRKKMFVYELGTLERIAQEIAELHAQFGFLTGYLGMLHGDQRSQRYAQLCDQPHIREALKRLRIAKRAHQAQPQSPRGAKSKKR